MAIVNQDAISASFSDETRDQVWQKATILPDQKKELWRMDVAGKWISYFAYGDRTSGYGWVIDRIKPFAEGGTDELSNLQPLHWQTMDERGA